MYDEWTYGERRARDAAAWPKDVDCSGENAGKILDAIQTAADDDLKGKVLSQDDHDIIVGEITVCRASTSFPDDLTHCGYITNARYYAQKHMWIRCSRELQLGHM